jgi:hypothetical protein
MWYILHAPILALRTIRFKFHGRLKQRRTNFQITTLETTQNDEHLCAYRHSVVLGSITGATQSTSGADIRMHARPMCQCIRKSKGLPIKQEATNWRASLYLLLFIRAFSRAQKARGFTGMCSKFSTWLTKFSKVFQLSRYHHRWFD